MPFDRFDLPDFPLDSLSGAPWLRGFVEHEATATQTPGALAAMLALAALAAACAKRIEVEVRDGHIEPVNIFTVVALEPGTRKTAVFADVVKPLEEFEVEEVARTEGEIAEAHSQRRILEAALRAAEQAAARGENRDQAAARDAKALARQLAAFVVPARPRLIADDCTPERLATLLAEQGGRIAVMAPEGDVFDLMSGRYSATGTPNFNVYLRGHAGDDLRVDRVGRPSEFIRRPAITLGVAVQPDVLKGLTGKPGFRGRGLLARLLYSVPPSLLGHRRTDAPPVPKHVALAYRDGLRALLRLPADTDEHGDPQPHVLRLDPAAQRRLRRFDAWLEPQLGEFGEFRELRDWSAKLVGAIARLAGLLHTAEQAPDRSPWTAPIALATVERAIAVGEYLIPHTRAAFAVMGSDPEIEAARRILAWIKRGDVEAFTKRDAYQGTRGFFKRVAALAEPLALLVEHGYIREEPRADRPGPGRKPSPIYRVNPLPPVPEFPEPPVLPAATGTPQAAGDCGDIGVSGNQQDPGTNEGMPRGGHP